MSAPVSPTYPHPGDKSVGGGYIEELSLLRSVDFLRRERGLHMNYKRLQEAVVCSEPNYHVWCPTPAFRESRVSDEVTEGIVNVDLET